MAVNVSTLPRRTPGALRAFVAAQRVRAQRHPDTVEPGTPSEDGDYWRYLRRRVALEGRCAYYQTYDLRGDENDWNLNIVPDESYRWMLDPALLLALSQASGSPSPIDLSEVKRMPEDVGPKVIECELTPDDSLYDTFTPGGLPITSGGLVPDLAAQQGRGPTGAHVGVYGAFVGDFGHGGRPEIHPFDAFWRPFHTPTWSRIEWDLGVFQDDSNRFNRDWSRPPIDVELDVPFCIDFPVPASGPRDAEVRFALRRSPLCTKIAKNTRTQPGPATLTETFISRGPVHRPWQRTELRMIVEDHTGVPGRPFRLSLADVTYTSSGLVRRRAWLAGSIRIRVAIQEDGYAYWRLTGPNSTTASTAGDDEPVVAGRGADDRDQSDEQAVDRASRQATFRVVETRPVLHEAGADVTNGALTAEVVVEIRTPGSETVTRGPVIVRPREEPELQVGGGHLSLESFDLFGAVASVRGAPRSAVRHTVDITAALNRLAGLEESRRQLSPVPATIEVDPEIRIELVGRYVPYRDGSVQGEERSALSSALTAAANGRIRVQEVVVLLEGATSGRLVTEHLVTDAEPASRPEGSPAPLRLNRRDAGRFELVIANLHEPTSITADITFTDGAGLISSGRAHVQNYRLIDAHWWLTKATRLVPGRLEKQLAAAERLSRKNPTPGNEAALGLLQCAASHLADVKSRSMVPATQVAGIARIIIRVDEMLHDQRLGHFVQMHRRRPFLRR